MAPVGLLGIGAVLDALREDFPDISISKIRYLETQGLITPSRTGSGFRKYSAEDVERLRFVLTAQRDRFWPLKVIREHLDALDRGLEPGETGSPRPVVPTPEVGAGESRLGAPRRPLRLTARELREAAGVDGPTLRDLVSYGLVRPVDEHYGEDDLAVARAAAQLVTEGVEVRHLRPFRTAAEREVGLVEHVSGLGRLRGRAADADHGSTDDTAARVAGACLDLHTALVRAELARLER